MGAYNTCERSTDGRAQILIALDNNTARKEREKNCVPIHVTDSLDESESLERVCVFMLKGDADWRKKGCPQKNSSCCRKIHAVA